MRLINAMAVSISAFVLATAAMAQEQPAPPMPAEPPPARPNTPQRENPARPLIPDTIELIRDVVYAEAPGKDGKPMELQFDAAFLKDNGDQPMPAVIYIHGGGYSGGSRDVGLPLSIALAQGGYFALTVQYRLTGDAIYPAAVHDVKSIVRFVRKNAEELGVDPDRIGVWGHSAGGHLSALLGTSGNSNVPELEGEVGVTGVSSAVTCVVDFFGPADFITMAEQWDRARAEQQRGRGANSDAGFGWFGKPVLEAKDLATQASPITYIDKNDPPFLILHGTEDRLVPIEQSDTLTRALKEAGVDVELIRVEGAGHGFPQPMRTMEPVAAFFDKHLGGKAAEALQRMREGREAGVDSGRRGRAADESEGRPARSTPE